MRAGKVPTLRMPPAVRRAVGWSGAGMLAFIAMAGLLLALAIRPAAVQEAEDAKDQAAGVSQQELERLLQQRDAVIIGLLRRVDALERRLAQVEGAAPPEPAAGPPAAARAVPEQTAATDAPARMAEQPPAPVTSPAIPAPKPTVPETAAPAAVAAPGVPPASPEPPAPAGPQIAQRPPAPGQFEIDEEAAERALERTLVQGGALLLNVGQAEITPSFQFTRRSDQAPILVPSNGGVSAASDEVRRNVFDWNFDVRFGLPFDSQLELGLPYRLVDQSEVISVRFAEQQENGGTGSGFGDLSVGVAKTLLREGRWWPDLIGRVTWDTATGQTRDGDVVLGGGFNEISGSLSATKRQDPLAFVGSVSYQKAFKKNDIKPGDELTFNLGTVLAASPETSLRFFLEQNFIDEVEVDGSEVDGSDLVVGSLNVGGSVILGPRLLLDVVAGVGLTDDAPDYSVTVSLPFRFDLPIAN
jgi:hypothetical protein